MKINEEEKQKLRDRLAEIRQYFLSNDLLQNDEIYPLISECNALNIRLKNLGG